MRDEVLALCLFATGALIVALLVAEVWIRGQTKDRDHATYKDPWA